MYVTWFLNSFDVVDVVHKRGTLIYSNNFFLWFENTKSMLLKVGAYASVITIFTALYFLRKTKGTSNYCNVERFKCESIPHIACSYNVSINYII